MESIVKNTVDEYSMIAAGQTVIAGFSGGADSMALLLFLCKNKDFYNIDVAAVHVNHLLRGEEAYRDEKFAKEQCEKLGVSLTVHRVDINKEAQRTGEGTEECARRIRYEIFDSEAKKYENSKIATAHTASDNAETVIFNMIRGSGLKGLCGIPPVRDNIIRPLIACTREDIEEYLSENGFSYITDSTNLEPVYSRNKIRKLVIPELKNINPAAIEVIARMSNALRADEDYLEKETKRALADSGFDGKSIKINILNEMHKSIKARVLRKACEECFSRVPDNIHLADIMRLTENGSTGRRIQLWDNTYCAVSYNKLLFLEDKQNVSIKKRELKLGNNEIPEANGVLKLTLLKKADFVNKFDKNNTLDYDKIKSKLFVRSREQGDSFTPLKRRTKTLKKLFIDEKIEKDKRDIIPVVTDGGSIVWVNGFGISEKYAPTADTINVLNITFERIVE